MILDDLPAIVGVPALWSFASIPALAVIWLTALFGLNDVRAHPWQNTLTLVGAAEFALGGFFFGMLIYATIILFACIAGAPLYTWREAGMLTCISGVFAFVGVFAPWRRWLATLAIRTAMSAAT